MYIATSDVSVMLEFLNLLRYIEQEAILTPFLSNLDMKRLRSKER